MRHGPVVAPVRRTWFRGSLDTSLFLFSFSLPSRLPLCGVLDECAQVELLFLLAGADGAPGSDGAASSWRETRTEKDSDPGSALVVCGVPPVANGARMGRRDATEVLGMEAGRAESAAFAHLFSMCMYII